MPVVVRTRPYDETFYAAMAIHDSARAGTRALATISGTPTIDDLFGD
jgi:hypothetical protein